MDISRQTLRHARAAQDQALEMRAQVDVAVDHFSLHDLGAAEAAIEILATAPDPHGRWVGLLGQASLALGRSALDDGLRLSEEAARFGEAHGLIGTSDAQVSQQLVVHWASGTLASFVPVMESVDWRAPSRSVWGAALALGLAQAGSVDDARALVREISHHHERGGFAGWQDHVVWALLAEGAHLSAAGDVAPLAQKALQRWTGGRTIVGLAADLGPVDRYLALACADLSELNEARVLLERAGSQAANDLWRRRIHVDRTRRFDERPLTGPPGPWSWLLA